MRAIGEQPILFYDTYDTPYDPNATEEQGAVRIWRVGTNRVDIVRERWHSRLNANRLQDTTGYFGSVWRHAPRPLGLQYGRLPLW